MKKAILVATIGAMTLGVNAGDWGKAPVGKAPIEECVDLGGVISAGYMTDYVFYGVRLAEDSVWTDVNYTIDSLAVPVTVGVFYLNGINEGAPLFGAAFDELDLYASAALGTFAGFDVALGYTHYYFPEAEYQDYGEIGLDIKRSLGFVDFAWESNFAFGTGLPVATSSRGWYHQVGFEKTFGISDNINLVASTGVAYSDGYWEGFVPNGFTPRSSGWNHYFVKLALPVELNCRTTLTPYIGYSGSPDTWIGDGINADGDFQSDILHGGVSLSVSF